jgi:hypothetical protein
MLEWLVDHPTWIYVTLGVIAVGLLIALWMTRKRKYAVAIGVVAVVAVLVWLVTVWVPTDQKRIRGAIDDMEAGVRAGDANRIFRNISRDFRIGGLDHDSFRRVVDQALDNREVDDIRVWDVDEPQISRSQGTNAGTATITFMVKPVARGVPDDRFFRVMANFVLEDGQWRLKGFELRDPVVNQPVPIPHVQ